jgi:hypothetical protein
MADLCDKIFQIFEVKTGTFPEFVFNRANFADFILDF